MDNRPDHYHFPVASPALDRPSAPASADLIRRTRRKVRAAAGGPRGNGRWRRRGQALRGSGGLRIVAAGLGGWITQLAYAPRSWWWAALLGLALYAVAVRGRRLWPAAGLGLIFGLCLYVPLLSWTTVYVGGIALALSIAAAVVTAPVAPLMASASRRLPGWSWPLASAAAWIAGQALIARFPFGGFPWGDLAFTQASGPLLPAASLLGASGLALITAAAGFGLGGTAVWLWSRYRRRGDGEPARRGVLIGAVVALIAPFGLGLLGRATEVDYAAAPHETIAVVQGDVPEPGLEFNARRRAVLDMHAAETHQLAADVRAGRTPKPTMVIWPENSSDIDPYTNADAAAVITSAAQDIGVPILVGAVTGSGDATYNRGIVWDPVTGPGQTYTKRHPVPFAEYMPWRSFFRIFSKWVDDAGFFQPGTTAGNLTISGTPVGDVICFEVVYDGLVHDVVDGGAQVLVVQTNNATFGYTNETYQQEAMSRVRAVEFGREVLISATSGVSAVIRPDGSVESTVGLFTPGYMTPSVPLVATTTPGTWMNAPIEWAATVAVLFALAGAWLLDRRSTRRNVVQPSPAAAQEDRQT